MQRDKLRSTILTMAMAMATALALSNGSQAQTVPDGSALPRLVRFSGTAKDTRGNPLAGVAGITFSLYAEPSGGAPLWSETQNVRPDPAGRYTVLLGASKPEGLPVGLFTAEQAHWVGVSIEGQPEEPRILLVSAPYALKAGDAETLGGLPPSAFLMAAGPNAAAHVVSGNDNPASATSPAVPAAAPRIIFPSGPTVPETWAIPCCSSRDPAPVPWSASTPQIRPAPWMWKAAPPSGGHSVCPPSARPRLRRGRTPSR